jgi:hypothetical protein
VLLLCGVVTLLTMTKRPLSFEENDAVR